MQVKGGSKMPHLLTHALGLLEDEAVKVMVWTGVGVAIPKAISCAEIVKRQQNIQHQVTKLTYKTDEEFWDPKQDGLETLVVSRQIPVIHIMLSVNDIIDKTQLGYQSQESKKFWLTDNDSNLSRSNTSNKSSKKQRNKRIIKLKPQLNFNRKVTTLQLNNGQRFYHSIIDCREYIPDII